MPQIIVLICANLLDSMTGLHVLHTIDLPTCSQPTASIVPRFSLASVAVPPVKMERLAPNHSSPLANPPVSMVEIKTAILGEYGLLAQQIQTGSRSYVQSSSHSNIYLWLKPFPQDCTPTWRRSSDNWRSCSTPSFCLRLVLIGVLCKWECPIGFA